MSWANVVLFMAVGPMLLASCNGASTGPIAGRSADGGRGGSGGNAAHGGSIGSAGSGGNAAYGGTVASGGSSGGAAHGGTIGSGGSRGNDNSGWEQVVASDDGLLAIYIPEGALPNGTHVTIAVAAQAPAGNVGSAYDLGPTQVRFNKPVLLTFQRPAGRRDLAVARSVNGTWKRLREAFVTETTVAALTDHFSEYTLIDTPMYTLSTQANPYAEACQIDCSPISVSCTTRVKEANGCSVIDIGWTTTDQRQHLACIEREVGLLTPKKQVLVTGPCGLCIRDCCATGLSVSTDFSACACGYNDPGQTGAWYACAAKCLGEPLAPGPNDACGTGGDTYYVTPTLTSNQGTLVETGSVRHGSTKLIGELTSPTGLALDEAGNLFFGEVLSGPARVILRKRAPDGTITDLGTVVETSAGYVSEGWAFSVAVSPTGDVVYTTPVLMPGPMAGGSQAGSIRQLGGGELVGGLVDEPAGLAFDGAGNLYFGTKSQNPVRFELHKRAPDGTLNSLGIAVDTSSGGVSTTWMFDIAVTRAGDVYFNTPDIVSLNGPGGTTQFGSIRKLGGEVIVANVSSPTGIAVDATGNIYFGERTSVPVRIQLKKRAPDGKISDLGRAVDTTIGYVANSWPFDLVVAPW